MEQKFCDWPSYEKNTPNTDTEKTLKKLENQVFTEIKKYNLTKLYTTFYKTSLK